MAICTAVRKINRIPKREIHNRGENRATDEKETHQMTIGHSSMYSSKKFHITVLIKGFPCDMVMDMGSYLTIVTWKTIKKAVPEMEKEQLKPPRVILKDFQGNHVPVIMSGFFQVKFKNFFSQLPLTMMNDNLPSLIGLQWFDSLGMG